MREVFRRFFGPTGAGLATAVGKSEVGSHPQGAQIEVDLAVRYTGFDLAVNLRLPERGVTVLLGHSGSGKTTVLRALAGLERAHGRVVVGGEVWQDDAQGVCWPTHQRPIGYVFQEASLFPHLSVRGNLQYGQKRALRAAQALSLEQAATLLGIEHLLDRRPDRLSGGERQRAAIARALLTSPRLLLMDEPLSALDAARKAEILPYLERLNRETRVPVVYVTHALEEAAQLADHVVLMAQGRVQAEGTVQTLTSRLDTPLSRLDEAAAVLDARVEAHEPEQGLSCLSVCTDEGEVPLWVGQAHVLPGGRVRVRVLARDVSVALSRAADSSILNVLPAVIEAMQAEGLGSVMLRLRVGPQVHVLARVTRRSVEALALEPGRAVFAQVKGAALLG